MGISFSVQEERFLVDQGYEYKVVLGFSVVQFF
jgi:hypothetical protein